MGLVEHDEMVEALSADRADQPFDIRGLPRRPEGDNSPSGGGTKLPEDSWGRLQCCEKWIAKLSRSQNNATISPAERLGEELKKARRKTGLMQGQGGSRA